MYRRTNMNLFTREMTPVSKWGLSSKPFHPSRYRPDRRTLLPPFQHLNLLPQHISPKRPERLLNPLPRRRIPRNCPPRRPGPSQQARLAAQEDSRNGKEAVGGNIASLGRADQGGDVWYRFYIESYVSM